MSDCSSRKPFSGQFVALGWTDINQGMRLYLQRSDRDSLREWLLDGVCEISRTTGGSRTILAK
ncbi:MAG: hypothetical protein ACYCSS_00540 [Sulfuriferula sp.]